MTICEEAQERIAQGEPPSHEQSKHVLACPSCSALTVELSLLEAGLSALGHEVPSGFADAVMARVAREPIRRRFFERPAVALALAYAGGIIALSNIAHFLGGTLIASVGLGGTP